MISINLLIVMNWYLINGARKSMILRRFLSLILEWTFEKYDSITHTWPSSSNFILLVFAFLRFLVQLCTFGILLKKEWKWEKEVGKKRTLKIKTNEEKNCLITNETSTDIILVEVESSFTWQILTNGRHNYVDFN